MPTKFVLYSRTLQGLVLMLAPTVSALFGFAWTDGYTADVGRALELLAEAAGTLWVLYARMSASYQPTLSLVPAMPAMMQPEAPKHAEIEAAVVKAVEMVVDKAAVAADKAR